MNPLWFETLRHMKLRYGFHKTVIMKSFLSFFYRVVACFYFVCHSQFKADKQDSECELSVWSKYIQLEVKCILRWKQTGLSLWAPRPRLYFYVLTVLLTLLCSTCPMNVADSPSSFCDPAHTTASRHGRWQSQLFCLNKTKHTRTHEKHRRGEREPGEGDGVEK